jgi:hypothetical protein
MRQFKPYVNGIHYTNKNSYVVNTIIELPAYYSFVDEIQAEEGKNWVVNLIIKKLDNMRDPEKDRFLGEFTIDLKTKDPKQYEKIVVRVKDPKSNSLRNGDGGSIDTHLDPIDFEEDDH